MNFSPKFLYEPFRPPLQLGRKPKTVLLSRTIYIVRQNHQVVGPCLLFIADDRQ